jgi:hypothetical protein
VRAARITVRRLAVQARIAARGARETQRAAALIPAGEIAEYVAATAAALELLAEQLERLATDPGFGVAEQPHPESGRNGVNR